MCFGSKPQQAPPPPPTPPDAAPLMLGAKEADTNTEVRNNSNRKTGKARLQIPLTGTDSGGGSSLTGLGIPSP